MFVDTSAILTREADADELTDALDAACSLTTSTDTVFKATVGICRKRHTSLAGARRT